MIGPDFLVYLIEAVGVLRRIGSGEIKGGRWPGAAVGTGIRGLDIKFHDGVERLGGNDRAIHPISCGSITAQAIVLHHHRGEGRRRGRPGRQPRPVEHGGSGPGGELVHDFCSHENLLGPVGHCGAMGHPADERRGICLGHGAIGGPGSRRGGLPVLTGVIGEGRVAELQGTASRIDEFRIGIGGGDPFQAGIGIQVGRGSAGSVGGIPDVYHLAHGPVAFIRIFDFIHSLTQGIDQTDQFASIPKAASGAPTGGRDVGGGGILGGERRPVGRDRKIAAARYQQAGREGEVDPFGESPAGQVHRGVAIVVDFEEFLTDARRSRRVVHDLADGDGVEEGGDVQGCGGEGGLGGPVAGAVAECQGAAEARFRGVGE